MLDCFTSSIAPVRRSTFTLSSTRLRFAKPALRVFKARMTFNGQTLLIPLFHAPAQHPDIAETCIAKQRRRSCRAFVRPADQDDRPVLEGIDLHQAPRDLADRHIRRIGDDP